MRQVRVYPRRTLCTPRSAPTVSSTGYQALDCAGNVVGYSSQRNVCGSGNIVTPLMPENIRPKNIIVGKCIPDYVILDFLWDTYDGKDLDTRVAVTSPARNVDVGWNRSSNDGGFVLWGGNNTGFGYESTIICFGKLLSVYPSQAAFNLRIRAFWYNSAVTGSFSLIASAYNGGSNAIVISRWRNSGGARTAKATMPVNTSLVTPTNSDGADIGVLTYTPATHLLTFAAT